MKTQIITLATLLATTACGGLDESDAELQPSAALTSTPRECAADRVYFAGQCRAVTYFERRASAGVTFVGVSGSRRIPVCPAGATCAASEVTLFEERTGEVAAIRVTDDANVAAGMAVTGLRHASGYRIIAEIRHRALPTTGESYSLTESFVPTRGIGPGASFVMQRRDWHSEEHLPDNRIVACGTDIAEQNAALGMSGECIEWVVIASGGVTSCQTQAANWSLGVFAACTLVGVGTSAALTQPETLVTAAAFATLAAASVSACAALADKVALGVQSSCAAGAPVPTSNSCATGGAQPGLQTVDGPQVDVNAFEGQDGRLHADCIVQSEQNQSCTTTSDGSCTCTTFSTCTRVTCEDGYEEDTGDC